MPLLQHYEAEQLWPPTLAPQLTLYTHTLTHTHSLIYTLNTHTLTQTHPHTQALSHTHCHTPPNIPPTHTPSYTHLHTHSHMHTLTHTPSGTHILTNTHAPPSTHKSVPVPELCSYLPQRMNKPGLFLLRASLPPLQFLLHSPGKEGGSKEQRI